MSNDRRLILLCQLNNAGNEIQVSCEAKKFENYRSLGILNVREGPLNI